MTKTELRKIAQTLSITNYSDYRDWLRSVYAKAKEASPSYSYALFSADLGLGSSNANLVVSGKRDLSPKSALRIAELLKLKKVQKQYLLSLIEYQRAGDSQQRDEAFQQLIKTKSKALPTELSRSQLAFYQHWYNAAILELLRLPDAKDSPEWICSRLSQKITIPKVKQSLALLSELGFVAVDEERGRLYPTDTDVSTGDEVYGMAVVSFHQQMIDLAKRAVDQIAPEEREISAVTLSVPKSLKAEIKEELIQLRKRLLAKARDCDHPDEIIQVNLQMFPLGSAEGDSH